MQPHQTKTILSSFKVIGELSPEAAKWVKEGDEFDEKGWKYKYAYDLALMETTSLQRTVLVKCPHCGTFT